MEFVGANPSSARDLAIFDDGTPLPVTRGGTGGTTQSTARSGIDAQEANTKLAAIAGLTMAADQVIYWTGAAAAAATGLTSVARTLLGRASIALMRTDLGFTTGTGTPSATPAAKGHQYFDVTNNELWVAIGTSTSADWRLVPRLKNPTTQAGATYTLVRADGDSLIRYTGATPTVTMPTNASVPFAVGTSVQHYCSGTSLTIANTRLQGSPLRTVPTDRFLLTTKIATDTWVVGGGIS